MDYEDGSLVEDLTEVEQNCVVDFRMVSPSVLQDLLNLMKNYDAPPCASELYSLTSKEFRYP